MTEMATAIAVVSRRAVSRLRGAMALMGLGLGTSGTGLAWDFYVHEIAKEAGAVESIFATPHLVIFAGIGIIALGFLWALAGERPSLAPRST